MLSVSSLSKNFGKVQAVLNVSFEVKKGSRCLLLGANGAGKSTIIKCIMGLLNYQGMISVQGLDVQQKGMAVRALTGYVPQSFSLFERLTLEEEAGLVSRLKGVSSDLARDQLERVNLWEARKKRIRELSQGMRQKFAIALALINDPPVLIFDEPLSSVDLKGRLDFQSLILEISKSGKTVLIATHLLWLSEFADEAVILDRGRVVANGSPTDLLSEMDSRDKLYIKIRNSDLPGATENLAGMGYQTIARGDWLLVLADSMSKSKILESLLQQKFEIDDVIVEPASIETEYLRLLEVNASRTSN